MHTFLRILFPTVNVPGDCKQHWCLRSGSGSIEIISLSLYVGWQSSLDLLPSSLALYQGMTATRSSLPLSDLPVYSFK